MTTSPDDIDKIADDLRKEISNASFKTRVFPQQPLISVPVSDITTILDETEFANSKRDEIIADLTTHLAQAKKDRDALAELLGRAKLVLKIFSNKAHKFDDENGRDLILTKLCDLRQASYVLAEIEKVLKEKMDSQT